MNKKLILMGILMGILIVFLVTIFLIITSLPKYDKDCLTEIAKESCKNNDYRFLSLNNCIEYSIHTIFGIHDFNCIDNNDPQYIARISEYKRYRFTEEEMNKCKIN